MKREFTTTLRKDLKVNRTTENGRRVIEVRGAGLTYKVNSRGAGRHEAESINSRIPIATIRAPFQP